MLNDDAGRLSVKLLHAFKRGIGIGNIIIRKRFALDLHRRSNCSLTSFRIHRRVAIKRCFLVRILPITQGLHLFRLHL